MKDYPPPPPPQKKKKKKNCTTIWACHHYYGVFCSFTHLRIPRSLPKFNQFFIVLPRTPLYYPGPLRKISSQSVHNFLSNVVHRKTNKATKNITSFAKEVINGLTGNMMHHACIYHIEYKNKVWRARLSWIFRARKAWWSHLQARRYSLRAC